LFKLVQLPKQKYGGKDVVYNSVIRGARRALDVGLSLFMAQRWPNVFGAM